MKNETYIILIIILSIAIIFFALSLFIPEAKSSIGFRATQEQCLTVDDSQRMYDKNGTCYIITDCEIDESLCVLGIPDPDFYDNGEGD